MVSMYHGVSVGSSALSYYRKDMEIAGVNTSNAKEAGYSRQVVSGTAREALHTGTAYSMLGAGVEISQIERMRDEFLDARMRRATIEAAYHRIVEAGMSRVETMVRGGGGADVSFSTALDSFWQGFEDLHISPSEPAVTAAALSRADAAVAAASRLSSDIAAYRRELDVEIRDMVTEANSLIDQIAVINRGIAAANTKSAAHALMDRRDLLADRLCEITGAVVHPSRDETDGDYKISIDGKIVVQGTRKRHIVIYENAANGGMAEPQIEYDQYLPSSDEDVAGVVIESRADDLRANDGTCTMDALHKFDIRRVADEMRWQVGHALADIDGGQRISISSDDVALGIDGSFALQVGTAGVRLVSHAYTATPPGRGVMLGTPAAADPTRHVFRISAGDYEDTITAEWTAGAGWSLTDSHGRTATLADAAEITTEDLANFINADDGPASHGIRAEVAGDTLILESISRNILSVTDIEGRVARDSGLANVTPTVRIDVTSDDTLRTIANKINNAYQSDRVTQIETLDDGTKNELHLMEYDTDPAGTVPSKPSEWLYATVERDAAGSCYLLLTSNEVGEAHRINVLPGSVCGGTASDFTAARLLGLVADGYDDQESGISYDGQRDITNYVQHDASTGAVTDRYTRSGDVFVDDAYIVLDGKKEFLSSENEFRDAREVAQVGTARADELTEFSPGIRVTVRDTGTTDVIVRHHFIEGEIYAALKLRDEMMLAQRDRLDTMVYELASQVNAVHRAGYGTGENEETTGMAFFRELNGRYGALAEFGIDKALMSDGVLDTSRVATASGDGTGHRSGAGDGSIALGIAQLKQEKLFMSGTADFNDYFRDFVTSYASLGKRSKTMLESVSATMEQISRERSAVMDVNIDEEMLTLTRANQNFSYVSRYLTTLMSVIDQIISGVGRVGL